MAHEDHDPFAEPPPAALPSEENLRTAIEAVAPKRYHKQREDLYGDLASKLSGDTRRRVLLTLLHEYQMHRRVPGRQRRTARRTVSDPPVDAAAYDQEREELEALLRRIENHPLVYHFCRAHMVRYPIEEAICLAHERWTKQCFECDGFDGPRVGRPVDTRRHRLLDGIVPAVRHNKRGTLDMGLSFVAAICHCLGDNKVNLPALRQQWHVVDRKRRKRELDLAKAGKIVTRWSQIRARWTPQLPDESTCLCRRRFPVT